MNSRYRAMLCLILLGMIVSLPAKAAEIVDALGRTVVVEETDSVAALFGSYGDVWLDAGGRLAGTTSDAVNTPAAKAQGDIANLGSYSEPNMELLLGLDPDFVILSADAAAHVETGEILEAAGIPCGFFSVDTYEDYMSLLGDFCALTGRNDLYDAREKDVLGPIEAIIAGAKESPDYGVQTALLLRASSGSVRAKGSEDTIAGRMIRDMGLINIADGESALSESLSMEAILVADPDWIFVVTMGADAGAAMQMVEDTLESNPAWATLTAVREGRYVVLEKELFHIRPNARWAEAYRVLDELLYE